MIIDIFHIQNYFEYIGGHPSYSYRSSYNIQNSPYDAN